MEPTPAASPALPTIIQGGMGAGVSNWKLARAVARLGHLGVVSGTALNTILLRRLQLGDLDGSMRRALARFPLPDVAQRILDRYFVPEGKADTAKFRHAAMFSQESPQELLDLTVAANFTEVYLAREGHDGLVGINLLEKVQLPTMASLFGAMLAGVHFVLMGAGIPRAIPGLLDQLAAGQEVSLRLAVEDAPATAEHVVRFDPARYLQGEPVTLRRPQFLAIVSSYTLALTLARKSTGHVDGFVIEGLSAGGHNAPPRGAMQVNANGEPIYGPRDHPDVAAIRALGRPFWLAGSYATPEKLRAALELGASGVQIGTAFAFCEESGLSDDVKQAALQASIAQNSELRTDSRASPTGMPFKVLSLAGTVSDDALYQERPRLCDLGYLRQLYHRPDGSLGYRCPGEPADDFVRKGGDIAETVGRKCLCNGLLAAIGLAQVTSTGVTEPAIITAGDDVHEISRFLAPGEKTYRAADVLKVILA